MFASSHTKTMHKEKKKKSYFESVPRTLSSKHFYRLTLPSFFFFFLSPYYATIACTTYICSETMHFIPFFSTERTKAKTVAVGQLFHAPRAPRLKSQQEYYNASTVVQEKVGKILHTQATGRRSDKTYGKILQANGKGPPPKNHPSRCHSSARHPLSHPPPTPSSHQPWPDYKPTRPVKQTITTGTTQYACC